MGTFLLSFPPLLPGLEHLLPRCLMCYGEAPGVSPSPFGGSQVAEGEVVTHKSKRDWICQVFTHRRCGRLWLQQKGEVG